MNEPGAPGPVTAEAPKPTLKQRVDGHPVGFIVGVAFAAMTATVTILVPLLQATQDNRVSAVQAQMEQDRTTSAGVVADLQRQLDDARRQAAQDLADAQARDQAHIDELDRSLSGIKRTLGTDTQYYDVGKLLVTPAEAATLPATSKFFPDDRFYGLDPAQSTGWTYQVASELGLTAQLLGVTEDQLRQGASQTQVDALTRIPVHVWQYGPDTVLSYVNPSDGIRYTIHPRTQAWVQRVSQDDFLSLLESSLPSPLPSAATLGESVREGFSRDPAGWVLQDQLVGEIASVGSLRPRIDSLQKRDDLAYARVETTFPSVQVGGQDFPEYYWDREWFIVRTSQDLYLVKLFVADDDHRSPDYGALSTWLDQLRILSN